MIGLGIFLTQLLQVYELLLEIYDRIYGIQSSEIEENLDYFRKCSGNVVNIRF